MEEQTKLDNYAISFIANVAANLFDRHHKTGKDINEWLEKVMGLHAVACTSCHVAWVTGIAGRVAESQDEARVGAHANEWLVKNGIVLCPTCKEK